MHKATLVHQKDDFNAGIFAVWKSFCIGIVGSEELIRGIARDLTGAVLFTLIPMTIALIWLSFWL